MKGLLQKADRILGPAAIELFGKSRNLSTAAGTGGVGSDGDRIRILIIRPGGMGDAVLTIPLIKALANRFPNACIDVLAEGRNHAVYTIGDTGVNEVLRYDKTPLTTFLRLRKRRYDTVIDTEQFHVFSTIYASRLGSRHLAGFDTFGRRKLLTHAVRYSESDYEVYSFLNLFEALTGEGAVFDQDQPFLAPGEEHMRWAETALGSGTQLPIATVMCAAGAARRLWPVERLAEACRHLAERGLRVLLVGGLDARERAAEVMSMVRPGSCTDFTGSIPLARTAALLARSSICLTPDTGILHLAYAVGTPTVSLFGSGLRLKWAPPGKNNRWISANLECSPCTSWGRTPECPRGNVCMTEITADSVKKALDELLASAKES